MLETPLLQTKDLRKSFGGLTATDGVSLDVRFGEIHALIGPNGAGKTTLVAQITGEQSPDEGDILLNGRSLLGLGAPGLCRARAFAILSDHEYFRNADGPGEYALGRRSTVGNGLSILALGSRAGRKTCCWGATSGARRTN